MNAAPRCEQGVAANHNRSKTNRYVVKSPKIHTRWKQYHSVSCNTRRKVLTGQRQVQELSLWHDNHVSRECHRETNKQVREIQNLEKYVGSLKGWMPAKADRWLEDLTEDILRDGKYGK